MNSEIQNSVASEEELYRHLFVWIGLLHTLQTSTPEECDTDLHHMRSLLLAAARAAMSYQGTNLQLKSGFEQLLDSLPQFATFYPSLMDELEQAKR
jgi:hypothetical protein